MPRDDVLKKYFPVRSAQSLQSIPDYNVQLQIINRRSEKRKFSEEK
jgi:hypothetical protein